MEKKGRKIQKQKSKFREYFDSIIIAVIAALIIRAFFIQAFRIPTGSMEDTLLVGDFLLVNKFIYGAKVPFTGWHLPAWRKPEPNDIIVFKYPRQPELDYIKRLIAVEGQTIEIRNKVVYVDGKAIPNPPEARFDSIPLEKGVLENGIFPPRSNFNRDNYGPITISADSLFVMGDNRDNSLDSRYWGFLPRDHVVGKALIIYWSWNPNTPLLKIIFKIRWRRIANLIH